MTTSTHDENITELPEQTYEECVQKIDDSAKKWLQFAKFELITGNAARREHAFQ